MNSASQNQIDGLEIIKKDIELSLGNEISSEQLDQIEEALKEIDFMSPFYNDFVRDRRIYNSQKALSSESTFMKILEDAIDHYKAK